MVRVRDGVYFLAGAKSRVRGHEDGILLSLQFERFKVVKNESARKKTDESKKAHKKTIESKKTH